MLARDRLTCLLCGGLYKLICHLVTTPPLSYFMRDALGLAARSIRLCTVSAASLPSIPIPHRPTCTRDRVWPWSVGHVFHCQDRAPHVHLHLRVRVCTASSASCCQQYLAQPYLDGTPHPRFNSGLW
jgi:hypothetical protein